MVQVSGYGGTGDNVLILRQDNPDRGIFFRLDLEYAVAVVNHLAQAGEPVRF